MPKRLLQVHVFYLALFALYALVSTQLRTSSSSSSSSPQEQDAIIARRMHAAGGRVRKKKNTQKEPDKLLDDSSSRLSNSAGDDGMNMNNKVSRESRAIQQKRRQRRLISAQDSLPECAQGLMVNFYRNDTNVVVDEEEEQDSGVLCSGILLRDDFVVADRMCIQKADMVMVLQPHPLYLLEHDEDTATMQAHERAILAKHIGRTAGIAQVDLPVVHYQSGWPRHRAFLQDNGGHRNGRNQLEVVCFDDLPVVQVSTQNIEFEVNSHNGEDDDDDDDDTILQYPEDVELTASMQNSLGEQWWVVKQPLEVLEARLSSRRHLYESPIPEGLDIFHALGDEAIIEPEDPKFRLYDFLILYYPLWREAEPFSGEPFYEWLDFGSGRHEDPDGLSRKRLNRMRGNVLDDNSARAAAVVELSIVEEDVDDDDDDEGNTKVILTYEECGKPVEAGTMIFVWGLDHKIYVGPDGGSSFHHICMLHAEPVLMAGEFTIGEHGALESVSPESGHYKPSDEHYRRLFRYMASKLQKLTPDTVRWEKNKHSPIKSPSQWNATFFDLDDSFQQTK